MALDLDSVRKGEQGGLAVVVVEEGEDDLAITFRRRGWRGEIAAGAGQQEREDGDTSEGDEAGGSCVGEGRTSVSEVRSWAEAQVGVCTPRRSLRGAT